MNHITDLPAIFGSDVFNEATMQQRLPEPVYNAWKTCVTTGSQLPLDVANEIAEGMKLWAIEKGATHYTHWFQPMTGITAEKHDSFIEPAGNGKVERRVELGVNDECVQAAKEAISGVSNVGTMTHFRRAGNREGYVIQDHVFW